MRRVKLLPWRYTMFGFGNRNTSYAFLAAGVFLAAGGSEYHIYAAVCAAFALVLAYMKIAEIEKELDRVWRGHDEGDRERMFADDIRELRREVMDLQDRNVRK